MTELQDFLTNLWAETPSEDKTFLFMLFLLGVALTRIRQTRRFPSWIIPAAILFISIIGMGLLYESLYYAISRGIMYGSFIIAIYEAGLKYLVRYVNYKVPPKPGRSIMVFGSAVILSLFLLIACTQPTKIDKAKYASASTTKLMDGTITENITEIEVEGYRNEKKINLITDGGGNLILQTEYDPNVLRERKETIQKILPLVVEAAVRSQTGGVTLKDVGVLTSLLGETETALQHNLP